MKNMNAELCELIYKALRMDEDTKDLKTMSENMGLIDYWINRRYLSFGFPRQIGKTSFIASYAWPNHIVFTRNPAMGEHLLKKRKELDGGKEAPFAHVYQLPKFLKWPRTSVVPSAAPNRPFAKNYLEHETDYSPLAFPYLNVVWFDECEPNFEFFEIWHQMRASNPMSYLDIFISLNTREL